MSGKGGKRDYARMRYDNIGLPRGPVVDFLAAEAALRGVPYATHLRDLLTDRVLALSGQGGIGLWFPRGVGAPGKASSAAAEEEAEAEESSDSIALAEEAVEENMEAFLAGLVGEEEDLSAAPTEPSLPAVR